MSDWTPEGEARQWRDWARDDARRDIEYQIYELRQKYSKRLKQIEMEFNARIAAANPPKIIKTRWGVLFA